ncbi:hypothetical protein [Novipirellula aureliae]|uniref:hypothetical protein n=1 Tax=Novipirellula aureliae TaxID=2527966 RepID=UPI0011B43E1A|nr:hypothetical protein [Novipirellula aureliae]
MRASRETELLARYPAKDVVSWIGNSVPVAMKSYAMATDEAFQAASDPSGQTVAPSPLASDPEPETDDLGCNRGCTGGCISGLSGTIEGPDDTAGNEKTPQKAVFF